MIIKVILWGRGHFIMFEWILGIVVIAITIVTVIAYLKSKKLKVEYIDILKAFGKDPENKELKRKVYEIGKRYYENERIKKANVLDRKSKKIDVKTRIYEDILDVISIEKEV